MTLSQSLTGRIFLLVAALLLASCTGAKNFRYRYGPDTTMPYASVESAQKNQTRVMNALVVAAGCKDIDNGVTKECLYDAAVAGFNFVDEQCDTYLHELFVLDKERDRALTGIAAADKLTSAILGLTSASSGTMAIVAQAFGLTSQFVDSATSSYLYSSDAGTIFHVVSTMQKEYKTAVLGNPETLDSYPATYSAIRGYLQLCMPPVIESKIGGALASATATTEQPTDTPKGKSLVAGQTPPPGVAPEVKLLVQ